VRRPAVAERVAVSGPNCQGIVENKRVRVAPKVTRIASPSPSPSPMQVS
jgi:hypothetical protein